MLRGRGLRWATAERSTVKSWQESHFGAWLIRANDTGVVPHCTHKGRLHGRDAALHTHKGVRYTARPGMARGRKAWGRMAQGRAT